MARHGQMNVRSIVQRQTLILGELYQSGKPLHLNWRLDCHIQTCKLSRNLRKTSGIDSFSSNGHQQSVADLPGQCAGTVTRLVVSTSFNSEAGKPGSFRSQEMAIDASRTINGAPH
jgi:hypothetical protein